MSQSQKPLDLNEPRFDQSTYWGRAQHFFAVTNPLNLFKSEGELNAAKRIIEGYKAGHRLPGVNDEQIWEAKYLYDSAFHPDTKEKMMFIGRMSFQVPGNMVITGGMLTFYKSTPAVIFWQWFNQSFNACVNYTNRSGDKPITTNQLLTSYFIATSSATGTALGLNMLVRKLPELVGRLVPFAAVAAANCINLPFMRKNELVEGIPLMDKDGNRVGQSKTAAKHAIAKVVFSRIVMASPSMVLIPVIMNRIDKRPVFLKYKWMNPAVQTLLCGVILCFATPLCCALFPQKSSISVSSLEAEVQDEIRHINPTLDVVFYNKGL